jgi:hypothetical protein
MPANAADAARRLRVNSPYAKISCRTPFTAVAERAVRALGASTAPSSLMDWLTWLYPG